MAYHHQQYDGYAQQQPRHQPSQQYYEQDPRHQRQQHGGYDDRYQQQYTQQHHQQQQYYDDGYDYNGHDQWDNGYHDQQGAYRNDQQHYGHQDSRGYAPQHHGRQHPPQDQYYNEQGYDDGYYQQQHQPQPQPQQQQQRPAPRQQQPPGRGQGPPSNPQQGRTGLRPPGFDRSLFAAPAPKSMPIDNPFPTFPTTKAKQASAQETSIEQGMAQVHIQDHDGQGRRNGPQPRSQPGPSQVRGPPPPVGPPNPRQDSGHFEGGAHGQRMPPPQRQPQISVDTSRPPPQQRYSDPKSPSQRAFGPGTQRSMTMPQKLMGDANHDQQGGYRGSPSNQSPPRPSTAGGVRQAAPMRQYEQRPPMPQAPPQQQYHAQSTPHPQEEEQLDNFYDDYYGDERKSMASTIDMPNFDAIPDQSARPGHRRGDSIDNHLSPVVGPSRGHLQGDHTMDPRQARPHQFQEQSMRSRSQPDLHEQYTTQDAPPVPALPRSNTGFNGAVGLPSGPRGHGPQHTQNYDPRYAQQAPQVQRGYSDESAYSEPPLNSMRSNPPQRPGTAAPAPGRMMSDPMGRRPGTTQPLSNPDSLPSHPMPVRAGLMQHNQQQPAHIPGTQSARPPPVRQYNSDQSRVSYESQQPVAQRPASAPHPVTHDELNRLRATWKANPSDNATGLQLAKKLVEAASVLADEGGTADTRTRNKNKERFVMEGHKIIKKLVHSGYADAMFYLADCYGQGLLGLQPDTKEAFALYQSAAKAGHPASAYRTAVCCEMGHEEGGGTKRDPLKAVQWYRRAAALGDTPALYKMGMILLKGLLGQQKNFGEAINMLKRAADNADRDNPHALHELGLIYEDNTGNQRIIRDEGYALQLFHQAADLGYKFSQFRLGQAYEYGLLGCEIDARTSIAWYTKSAAQEEHQSELALSGWYLTGIQGVLEQSDTEAYLWARKAACAEPPLPKALFAMGYFTEVGIGCPRSLEEAKRWYGRAAAYKFPKAQERLEELKKGGSKAQMSRERLSRTNQKQQEENCVVM